MLILFSASDPFAVGSCVGVIHVVSELKAKKKQIQSSEEVKSCLLPLGVRLDEADVRY